jgi:aspartyl-tRNA(Asn)/glutamyl-tRNA(Gln) amidotransferase subunit A
MPLSFSLDCVGPLTRTVRDAARLLSVIAGPDSADASCLSEPVPDYERACHAADPCKLVIGITEKYFWEHVTAEHGAVIRKIVCQSADIGTEVRPVALPDLEHALAAANVLIGVESLALHRRSIAAHPEGYSEPIRRRIENGLGYTGYEYLDALKYRAVALAAVLDAISEVDVLAVPTLGIATPTQIEIEDTEADDYSSLVAKTTHWTRPVNYLGLPAISIPCGMTSDGLPIGLQLVGKPFQEARLLQAAAMFEDLYDPPRLPDLPTA